MCAVQHVWASRAWLLLPLATMMQALGVLLYVLVFGKLPFQGDSKLSVLFGKVR